MEMSHGGIKELVRTVVQDLHGGAQVEEKFDEVEIIEAFLGSDAAPLLDKAPQENMPTLREVIVKDIIENSYVRAFQSRFFERCVVT